MFIITVSNRLEQGEKRAYFHVDFLLGFSAPVQSYTTASGEAALWLYSLFI